MSDDKEHEIECRCRRRCEWLWNPVGLIRATELSDDDEGE